MSRVWRAAPALLLAGQMAFASELAPPPSLDALPPPPVSAPSATAAPDVTTPAAAGSAVAITGQRSGLDIYRRFRQGLASEPCATEASRRYQSQFAHAPQRLADPDSDLLPLFGYVVDALADAHLPTEYALIPFVESGYRPGARSALGPAGMWQFIATTARNHEVPVRPGYDGRLSPVDSTRAAVRYLKTLHGMFAGDWRLAVMAYNAGEYRVLGALKRNGMTPANAQAYKLTGMPAITYAYVRKLDALSCLLAQAETREDWRLALDRPVPRLEAVPVPTGIASIEQFAARTGQDAERLKRLNPAFADGHLPRRDAAHLLAWASSTEQTPSTAEAAVATTPVAPPTPELAPPAATPAVEAAVAATPAVAAGAVDTTAPAESAPTPRTLREHIVARGESAWTIARRYGMRVGQLLQRNNLTRRTVLKPGQRLLVDALAVETP
ncbi:MAG TPA: transglycosylase SLT domain-containing protein [Lysobacter sp.]|nr:transglycosylase SLT domain-containing protein [Lysobacter sp.]